MAAKLIIERRGAVVWLTLNRPNVLNAIDFDTIDLLIAALGEATTEVKIRAVAITGAGRAFSTGADMAILSAGSPEERRRLMARGHAMMTAIESVPKPVIAAVNGIAAGGGFELLLACDFVVAEEQAQFGMTEIRYGFLPGAGGTQRLPRAVVATQAKYLLWTGEMIGAARAADLGIVTRLAPNGTLHEAVDEFAAPLLERNPAAIAEAKVLARVARDRPLSEGLAEETQTNMRLLQTAEAREAMARFVARHRTKAP